MSESKSLFGDCHEMADIWARIQHLTMIHTVQLGEIWIQSRHLRALPYTLTLQGFFLSNSRTIKDIMPLVENKTEIFVNINLAIVATYVVFAQDMKKNKQPIFSIISYTFSVFRAECVKMIDNTLKVTVMLKN